MNLFDSFAVAFFNVFGITQPSPTARRRASWFLCALLVVALVIVSLVGWMFYQLMYRA